MTPASHAGPVLRSSGRLRALTRAEAKNLGLTVQDFASLPVSLTHCFGHILERSLWAELPLAKGWIAAFRVCRVRGVPVVAELRIFPAWPRTKRPAGQWRGEYGSDEGVPPGGLTARHMRTVHFQAFKNVLRVVVARWRATAMPLMVQDLFARPPLAHPARPGRKGRPDHELARIAAVYETAYLANRSPVAAVVKQFGLSQSRARDVVYRARVRGLLTPADKQGSAGGLLTAQGRALLAHPKPTTPRAQQTKRRTRHGSKR